MITHDPLSVGLGRGDSRVQRKMRSIGFVVALQIDVSYLRAGQVEVSGSFAVFLVCNVRKHP